MIRKRLEWLRKQTSPKVYVGRLEDLKLVVHGVCKPVSITMFPDVVHEFADGVPEGKHPSRLAVNHSPTEFRLDAFILGDEWFLESLLDENRMEFTVRHGPVLSVLWGTVTSMGHPCLLLSHIHGRETYRVYNLLERRLEISDDVLHYMVVALIFYLDKE